MPGPLPPHLLAALGLAHAETGGADTADTADTSGLPDTGADTSDTGSPGDSDFLYPEPETDTDISVCLSLGPCLSVASPLCGCDATGLQATWMLAGALAVAARRRETRAAARKRVLARGVLPDDVARALADEGD
jgi:hypothetical protein